MNLFNKKLSKAFSLKHVVKVIAGLDNIDIQSIVQLANLSQLAGCTYIDIVANPRVVSILKSLVDIPICISSINPLELYNCVVAGADIVELGNFDIFYRKKMNFQSDTILGLAIETRQLIRERDICVTIPHTLDLVEQIALAKSLEIIGINLLQTEGYTSKSSDIECISDNLLTSTRLASSTLSSTYAISQSVGIPVITSSHLNSIASPMAFFYGASGIGIGSFLKNQSNLNHMLLHAQEIISSIDMQKYDDFSNFDININHKMHKYDYCHSDI